MKKDTPPIMPLQRKARELGYLHRLHVRKPSHPNLVFAGRREVLFFCGCFRHCHPCLTYPLTRTPKSRLAFWRTKFEQNVEQDRKRHAESSAAGWDVSIMWEYEIADRAALRQWPFAFLGASP